MFSHVNTTVCLIVFIFWIAVLFLFFVDNIVLNISVEDLGSEFWFDFVVYLFI